MLGMTDDDYEFSKECIRKFILAERLGTRAVGNSITTAEYDYLRSVWHNRNNDYAKLWGEVEQEMANEQ